MPEELLEQESAPAQAQPETVTISKSELESLQRTLRETQESERTWASLARRGAQPQAEQTAEEVEALNPDEYVDSDAPDGLQDDTADKVVADIASKGAKALSDRGFVTAKQAQRLAVEAAERVSRELIGREVTKQRTDNQIFTDFPELRDQGSELFKETAVRFQKAVALDPGAKKTPAALYLAAQAAKEHLEHKAAPAPRRASDDDDFEDEGDRQARAASQAPSRSRGIVEDPDDMLGAEARAVIRGMGISEADFKASQKELAGTRGRRK